MRGAGGGVMDKKTLSQKVADVVIQKSFSYIPLKRGEKPQDNPFLREGMRLKDLRHVKNSPREPVEPTATRKE
jgi:hypothetical protein